AVHPQRGRLRLRAPARPRAGRLRPPAEGRALLAQHAVLGARRHPTNSRADAAAAPLGRDPRVPGGVRAAVDEVRRGARQGGPQLRERAAQLGRAHRHPPPPARAPARSGGRAAQPAGRRRAGGHGRARPRRRRRGAPAAVAAGLGDGLMAEAEVRAAGGAVWRRAGRRVEVLVVHRPRYDDWSLPKGKLEAGESFEQAARREVAEEAGVAVELGDELRSARYLDRKGRPKLVRYWAMRAVGDVSWRPTAEVDDRRWVALDEAEALLTYAHDRLLVRQLRDLSG